MAQSYRQYIRWNLEVAHLRKPDDHFSKKRMQKIRQSLTRMDEAGYALAFEDLTEPVLDAFVMLYNAHISKMEGGKVYPVKESVLKHQSQGREYAFLALRSPDKTLLGGLIFSKKDQSFSIAYRIFPHKIDVKLSTSVSYIGEYLLVDLAMKEGKKRIVHGKDRNAYGLNAAIGLAAYKLHVGATPYISKTKDNPVLELPDTLGTDVLLCTGLEPGERCEELILYTSLPEEDIAQRYPFLASFDDVPIRVEPRSQA